MLGTELNRFAQSCLYKSIAAETFFSRPKFPNVFQNDSRDTLNDATLTCVDCNKVRLICSEGKELFRGTCFSRRNPIINQFCSESLGAHLAPTTLARQWIMQWNLASRTSPIVFSQNMLPYILQSLTILQSNHSQ